MKRVNYLNNRDLLAEIHKSKNSYSSYVNPEDSQYDMIVTDIKMSQIRALLHGLEQIIIRRLIFLHSNMIESTTQDNPSVWAKVIGWVA